ncbi:MAG: glycosyltransferase [Bacteroidales bacterium]|nr:glycosyltransferase [Bacteroidales bacterium]
MESKKYKVLVISSVDPSVGPAVVAEDFYNRLKKNKFDVDFMTTYAVKDHPEYLYVYKSKHNYRLTPTYIYQKLLVNNRIARFFRKQLDGYYFFYRKETNPPMSINDILKSIKRKYDIVVVVFWQGMLSFKTIEKIYDKLNCLFIFRCIDYSPMSGGCHFTVNCNNYKTGCGKCPGILSTRKNDFTSFNVKYRKKVYEKVKPIVTGNTYMHMFYDKSYLLKDYDRKIKTIISLDLTKYKQQDREKVRLKYNIPNEKKFILFFGSQNLDDPRKGMKYLLAALKEFSLRLNNDECNSILLIIAGRNIDSIKDKLCFEYLHLGYINTDELVNIYSLADVFLSPSVDDAGPSMVNQALACGTPVVAFEMGTALDCVKDKNTGYCAKLKDFSDFAFGIEKIFRMSKYDYNNMRLTCRNISEKLFSENASISRFEKIIDEFYGK